MNITTRIMHRCGMLGFLAGGALGTLTGQEGGAAAEAPAIWRASSAIVYAFQAAGIGLIVGSVLAWQANKKAKQTALVMAYKPTQQPPPPPPTHQKAREHTS